MIEQKSKSEILDDAPSGWITSAEKAAALGITEKQLSNMVTLGKLHPVRVRTTGRGAPNGYSLYHDPDEVSDLPDGRARTVGIPLTLLREAQASVALDHGQTVSVMRDNVTPISTPRKRAQADTPALNSGPSVDPLDMLTDGIMAARGITWADLSAHLNLGVEHKDLVANWISLNGVPAFSKALLDAPQLSRLVPLDAETRSLLQDYERATTQANKDLANATIRAHGLNARVDTLTAEVRERNDELARQQSNIKSMEILIAQLRREMADRDMSENISKQIEKLTAQRDEHARNAQRLTTHVGKMDAEKAALINERNSLAAQLSDERTMVSWQETEINRLRAVIDKRVAGSAVTTYSAPSGPDEPISVSGVIMACLRTILDPKNHPSGESYIVGPPYAAKDVCSQMARSGKSNMRVAIKWIEQNLDLYNAGLGYGFIDSGNGRIFKVGE